MFCQHKNGKNNKRMAGADDKSAITTTMYTLNNGVHMPAVGFGTYRIKTDEIVMNAVDEALAAGYRLFDTAAVYHNEISLGKAFKKLLPKYNLEREDIFITSKILPVNHGGRAVIERAYQNSLDNLGIDYIDMYIIHFPGTPKIPAHDKRNVLNRITTWNALMGLYDDGRVNSVGVSNFTVNHLKELLKSNHSTIPAVNQVEWHPFYYQPELLKFCKENNILLQAYSSLGGASVSNDTLIKHPVVTKIAMKLNVTAPQVLLAWALHQDIAVIPKSTNPEHIKENICLNIKISNEDMQALSKLGSVNTKYAWDPTHVS